ncbi:hypothetical protein AALC75_26255 [Lachnospiraceae bacterium 48-42]
MKKINTIFIVFCLIILLIPFAGMAVAPTNETTENKVLSEFPKLSEERKLNVDFLNDLGEYFTDHFAFRPQMVSSNAQIYGKLFGTSTTDQVLIGKNNWMYYTETLNDYTGQHLMTERALKNVVHNLALMQKYVESRGSEFLLVIAPNKNSIYDENMPYYYRKRTGKNNYERLMPLLDSAGIHYTDLFTAFAESDEVLYLERDSHWTNKGAVLAYNQIMENTDLDYETYEHIPYEVKKDHMGDLTEMLYPENSEPDENEYYQKEWLHSYNNEVTDNMDDWIETSSPKSDACLLMYRDSFGESILPFLAEEFGNAYFSRLVPYNLLNVDGYQPDYTVIERTERRLSSFAEQAAVMQTSEVQIESQEKADTETTLNITEDGGYYVISGRLDDVYQKENSEIYVKLGSRVLESFYISSEMPDGIDDYGYMLYVSKDAVQAEDKTVEVLVSDGSQVVSVKTGKIK